MPTLRNWSAAVLATGDRRRNVRRDTQHQGQRHAVLGDPAPVVVRCRSIRCRRCRRLDGLHLMSGIGQQPERRLRAERWECVGT